MITATIEQTIFEITFGNLKVQEFSTADEVELKLDDIRSKMKIKDPDIYGFDLYADYTQDRFEEIYDIAPGLLMHLLGN
jgi:hypothetical protein